MSKTRKDNKYRKYNSRMNFDLQMQMFKDNASVPDYIRKNVKIKNLKKGNWYAGLA